MKAKIAIFISSLSGGGAEKVVSILLHELQDNFDLHLVLMSDIQKYPIPHQTKIHYIEKKGISENPILNLLKIPYLGYKYYQFCKKNQISVSLSFLNRPNFIATFSTFFSKKTKIIISERIFSSAHYKNEGKMHYFFASLLIKFLYDRASVILPNAKLIEQDLRRNFGINKPLYNVIYNPNIVKKNTIGKFKKNNNFTFITIGRLVDQKKHIQLLEAFALLRRNDVSLIIIGEGHLKDILKNKTIELGIESKVNFIGFTDSPQNYLLMAHCFVLSSIFEGFPNVILEALTNMLPVIATDCPSGPREILAPNTNFLHRCKDEIEIAEYGILVPINNPKLLANAMQEIIDNDTLRNRFSQKSIQRAMEFDVSKIIPQFQLQINSFLQND